MKVCELEGDDLDYWAAQANGDKSPYTACFGPNHHNTRMRGGILVGNFTRNEIKSMPGMVAQISRKYSRCWQDGGPIIDRERIALQPISDEVLVWKAYLLDDALHVYRAASPLVAAMRAFVASKFGDEVNKEAA